MENQRTVRYTGLKGFRKPNEKCHYKSYWEKDLNFDHEVEDGQCYSPTCRVLSESGWNGLVKEANKSPKKMYKEFMEKLNN